MKKLLIVFLVLGVLTGCSTKISDEEAFQILRDSYYGYTPTKFDINGKGYEGAEQENFRLQVMETGGMKSEGMTFIYNYQSPHYSIEYVLYDDVIYSKASGENEFEAYYGDISDVLNTPMVDFDIDVDFNDIEKENFSYKVKKGVISFEAKVSGKEASVFGYDSLSVLIDVDLKTHEPLTKDYKYVKNGVPVEIIIDYTKPKNLEKPQGIR